MLEVSPCPKCHAAVNIVPMCGGRGSREPTAYAAECSGCKHRVEYLPSNNDGRRASAIREWNKLVREGRAD